MLFTIISFLFLPSLACSSEAQTWIKAGYWYSVTASQLPVSAIDSTLFTQLTFAFAYIDNSTYELVLGQFDEPLMSTFTNVVRQKNPSITTLLSIWTGLGLSMWTVDSNLSNFFSMAAQPLHRTTFIESSIRRARLYGFDGLELCCIIPDRSATNMKNMGILFDDWRTAINRESKNSTRPPLILTLASFNSKNIKSYPMQSILMNFDWVNILSYFYHLPAREKFTGAHSALNDPSSNISTDYAIKEWMSSGLPPKKMVLVLPYFGYAWKLLDPKANEIGSPAVGPAISPDGMISYRLIKSYVGCGGDQEAYNSTYVINYCVTGSVWIGYDGVEAIRTKVSYAREKGLLGYKVWHVADDVNWVLSKAAAKQEEKYQRNKGHFLLLVILLPTAVTVTLIPVAVMWYLRKRTSRNKGRMDEEIESRSSLFYTTMASTGNADASNLLVFSLSDLVEATNNFSFVNKLGEGGYGPVYKGILRNRQEIAVKRLSRTSTQGFEEFTNEVMLTAKLQHVNLVRVLGFCTENEEQMLIYEYMPNKSLDHYLYDPIKGSFLHWENRVQIIEGVTQGLLYLQEYSRLTIIHRDLKASNILLDKEMKPKIADFGMARIFRKDEFEANTSRIVGTYGYIPPEYANRGIYSTKSDVYSFGVLLLQIVSGKRNNCLHGLHEDLNLLEYAYDLWKSGKGVEFMDPLLDDTNSSCKLMRCLQIALLCVQENPAHRPSMLELSEMLKNETASMRTPKRPAFSTRRDEDEVQETIHQQEIWSVGDVSITQMVAR